MADIRCPHCGKDNPDFLDVCQFCQSPLKSESMLHIGEKPTKKNTGELENVLPDWLKTARQQARDIAEEEAAHAATQPKVQKDEPLDLLAGLAFQSESSDDESVPDWLSSISPAAKSTPAAPVTPEPATDFFAQFNKSQPEPESGPVQAPQKSPERDELSEWFVQASEQPVESLQPDQSTSHSDWEVSDAFSLPSKESPAPKEEEDLSWLHNLEATAKQTDELKAPKPSDRASEFSAPAQSTGDEDLSWLNNLGAISSPEESTQSVSTSQSNEDLSWLDSLGGTPLPATPESSGDDLSWLNPLGSTPAEPPVPAPSSTTQADLGWLNNLGDVSEPTPAQPSTPQEDLRWLDAFNSETSVPSEPASAQPASQDDTSWLKDLSGTSPAEESAPAQPAAQEDLRWLNTLGETSQPSQPAASSQEDLSWLNTLGATPAEPTPAQPSASQDDLGWLSAFGETSQSSQPPSTSSQQEDLSWLNTLGATSEKQPSALQNDLSWLNNLQGEPDIFSAAPFSETPSGETSEEDVTHVSPFVPRKTAPLDDSSEAPMPDWLKNATEGPSMPMGAGALDQFREDYKIPSKPEEPFSWKNFTQESQTPPSQPEPAFADSSPFVPSSESSTPSQDDINSLFSMEMPDWLSQAEPAKEQPTAQDIGIHAEGGEALAPVDLPSWVQAMRPVDAALSEAVPSIESQPTEREGPLAGFRGVLPMVPLGSARRPKPLSLKLQASDEQQASAAILEQLLAGETAPRPLVTSPALANQRVLRWVLTALFIVVLSGVIGLRSQLFAPSALLPVESRDVGNAIQGLPDGANVLVVMDYEPALAGEMEAVGGPLLDQLAMVRHPKLSFMSTSPNGPALVERLILNTGLDKPSGSGEPGYSAGQNYFNLGYLAGAESGVLAFIQSPKAAMPSATVNQFSGYSAVIVLTDNADSARTWVEQLQNEKQNNSSLALQPLIIASSAQAGPMLLPYVSSRQINGLITGLADASRFEFVNNSRPGIARSYWDAFGVGLIMAIGSIFLGSLWSIFAGIRARRTEAAEG